MIWPEDVPPELAAENRRASFKVVGKNKKPTVASETLPDSVAGDAAPAARSPVSVVPEPPDEEAQGARPQLALAAVPVIEEPVVQEESDDSDPEGDDPDDGGNSKLPPYLRVIK